VPLERAIDALRGFQGVRRRLTRLTDRNDIRLYDDFAHHPTAIRRTLQGFAGSDRRLVAVLEPRSNTMRRGDNAARLAESLEPADRVFVLAEPGLGWNPAATLAPLGDKLDLETT